LSPSLGSQDVFIGGAVTIEGSSNNTTALTVVSTTSLCTNGSNLTVGGPATLQHTLTVTGDATFNGTGTGLTVTNNASIGGNLSVTGNGTISGNFGVTGNEIITGYAEIKNGLILLNGFNSASLNSASTGSCAFTFPAGNGSNNYILQTDGGGNTSWTGDPSLNTITTSGNGTIGGDLTVNGSGTSLTTANDAMVGGTLTAKNLASIASLSVGGDESITGNSTINGNLAVNTTITTPALILLDAPTTYTTTLYSSASSSNTIFILPPTNGSNNNIAN